jgi:hypothetical protein
VAPADPARGHFNGQKNRYRGRFQQQFVATGKVGVFEAGKDGIIENDLF